MRAVFFGIGSDGTVGANKNTIKILGSAENCYAQGISSYDSKKSGSQTDLAFAVRPKSPIRAPYLVHRADFVGCHQFERLLAEGRCARIAPRRAQRCSSIVALTVRRGVGQPASRDAVRADPRPNIIRSLGHRRGCASLAMIGTGGADQHCVCRRVASRFPGCCPKRPGDRADKRRRRRRPTGGAASIAVARKISSAVGSRAVAEIPAESTSPMSVSIDSGARAADRAASTAPDRSCRHVTTEMIAGRGDRIAGQRLADRWQLSERDRRPTRKRNISDLVAEWDPDLCIQCGNCSFAIVFSAQRDPQQVHTTRSSALQDAPAPSPRCH